MKRINTFSQLIIFNLQQIGHICSDKYKPRFFNKVYLYLYVYLRKVISFILSATLTQNRLIEKERLSVYAYTYLFFCVYIYTCLQTNLDSLFEVVETIKSEFKGF